MQGEPVAAGGWPQLRVLPSLVLLFELCLPPLFTCYCHALQSIRDGKPIIIEGLHIDPAIYLKEFGEPARSTGDGSARQAGAAPPGVAGDGQGSRHQQQAQASVDTSDVEHLAQRTRRSLSLDETASAALYKQQSPWRQGSGAVGRRRPSSAQVSSRGSSGQVTFMLRSMSEERWLSPQITAGRDVPPLPRRLPASTQEESGGTNGRQSSREPLARSRFGESTDATVSAAARIETKAAAAAALPPPGAAAGPVFVPVVLSVPEEDYEALARDWYAGQRAAGAASSSDAGDDEEHLRAKVLPRLRALQQHLESREVLGVPVVRMGAGGFADAVDRLHEYVLECIALAQHQHRELTAGSGDGEEQEEQRV